VGKRLLIHYPVLNVGGAEMSTLRLARALCDRGWDVEMVVTTGGGPMESALDPRVKLTALRSGAAGTRFTRAKGLGKLFALDDLAAYALQRLREARVMRSFRSRDYDAAVVGLHGLSPAFVCETVNAKRRLHFIRNDLGACDANDKAARGIERFSGCIDAYVCVAETARQSLVRRFPQTAGKAVTIYNVIDAAGMRARAEGQPDPFPPGEGLKVLSVCRLSEEAKGLTRMARACRRLLDEGLDFRWYVAGDGPDRGLLEKAIAELGLTDRMILLGRQPNPFPYYAHADVVAVLSNYEGLCGAVNEAKVMGKAVIATTFSGVFEQLKDGESGLIVANDEDAIVEGLRRVLTDTELRARLAAGPLNPGILDDEAKLDRLEALLLGTAP
jgi:glycosyltransferase involved in cell wall biosynthesis